MQPFYAEGGFEIAFRDERHKTIGRAFDLHEAISELQEADLPSLLDYDRRCFGYDRQSFMRAWMAMPNLRAFTFKDDGELKGFAMLRSTQNGFKICPLFADDPFVAEELYKACASACQGHDVFLDIPMVNTNAVELMKRYDSEYVFECARMYYGPAPEQAIDKVYGITTFELG